MAREIDEWVGRTDDSPIPPRVRLRVYDRFNGVCQCGCTVPIRAGDSWQADHIVAIINGGENMESNLHPLLTKCHQRKTVVDVRLKSKVYKTRSKHLGIKPKSRFPGGKGSKLKKKINGQVVPR